MSAKKFILMGSMAIMGIAFMSCSHDSLYDEGAILNEKEAKYAANFEKRFGKIDPNKSWDLTTGVTTTTLGSMGMSGTRAAAPGTKGSFKCTVGTKEIDASISQWMLDNLPKGKNNSGKGTNFTMTVGPNDFTVVPLFQGCASYYWQLWMHVEDVGDVLVWSKGDKLQYKKNKGDTYTNVGTDNNGMTRANGACYVNAPTFTYDDLPTGKSMYFYLKVWTGGDTQYQNYLEDQTKPANKPVTTSSLDAWMIDLQGAPVPDDLPEGYTATIIGCEDKQVGSDLDYEDLVFMVYGNPVPPTKRVDDKVTQSVKRYMMEDLGDTDDFDFNDVVIDVYYNRVKTTYYYEGNSEVPYDTTTEELPNWAVVRAAGGIYNFTVKFGGTAVWSKSDAKSIQTTDMVNTQVGYDENYILADFEAEGYDYKTNNISVDVETRGSSEGVYTIKFPEAGKAPKIIAVDGDVKWMTERKRVPDTWLSSTPQQ